jgi:hypothetical protein
MNISYTWQITKLKTKNVNDLQDAVIQTYWTKTGRDDNGNEGVFTGATPIVISEDTTNFIPFNQLTEEQVLEWIKEKVTGQYEDHVNAQILKQIEEKLNQSTEKDLPWQLPSS